MATTAETTKTTAEKRAGTHPFVVAIHGVGYQVKDVARSVAFYTTHLGFGAVLRVNDLQTFIQTLKKAGLRFRNDMETGPGGKQIQIEDPDGNPIELFEPAR